MGYYIHGCKKMRYKGDYRPQYVLDYHGLTWDILDDEMRSLMEKRKWASMSLERTAKAARTHAESERMQVEVTDQSDHDATCSRSEVESAVRHPIPVDAMQSSLSLLELGMTGVMSLEQVQAQINLDTMRVFLGRGGTHKMRHIVVWDQGSEKDPSTVKGIIAEYAAAVGPNIAKDVVVDLSR